MSTVRVFKVKVKCEKDWPYPDAIVAIRQFSKLSQETGVSSDCKEDYVFDSAIEAISYRCNFWPDADAQARGLSTRPLIGDDNPDDPQLLNVDLEHLHSVQVRNNSSMTGEDKTFRLILLDITRRFA